MDGKLTRELRAIDYRCGQCGETHEPYYDGYLFRARCCGAVCGEERTTSQETDHAE